VYKAKLASPSSLTWLDSTANAVTYSVHDRSCTLLNDQGKLLSVVLPEIGPGPFSVVIDRDGDSLLPDDLPFSKLQVGAPVAVGKSTIKISGILIDMKDVVAWAPRLAWESLDNSKLRERGPELRRHLILHGAPGSLSLIVGNGALNNSQAQLYGSWLKIADGLRKHDLRRFRGEIGRIAGLGIGLTPAGDDFLVGVIMAIWFLSPVPVAERMAKDISSAVSGKTTILSQAYIDAAGKGEAGYPWHELIESIAAGNRKHMQEATIRLIKTGSTSGSDALTGFLLACEILDSSQ